MFAPVGSSECLPRPVCQAKDWSSSFTPCVDGVQSQTFDWLPPKTCRGNEEALPKKIENIACSSAPPSRYPVPSPTPNGLSGGDASLRSWHKHNIHSVGGASSQRCVAMDSCGRMGSVFRVLLGTTWTVRATNVSPVPRELWPFENAC